MSEKIEPVAWELWLGSVKMAITDDPRVAETWRVGADAHAVPLAAIPAEALRASFMEGLEAAAKLCDGADYSTNPSRIAAAIRAIKYPEGK